MTKQQVEQLYNCRDTLKQMTEEELQIYIELLGYDVEIS